jgi:hypothetical protein
METADKLEARIAPYREQARKAVAEWPPLTEKQLREIGEIIHGVSLAPVSRQAA